MNHDINTMVISFVQLTSDFVSRLVSHPFFDQKRPGFEDFNMEKFQLTFLFFFASTICLGMPIFFLKLLYYSIEEQL